MIFQMRFQIWLLAGALAASMLAGYAVSENPIPSPAGAGSFALAGEFDDRPTALFTDFGNEMTWHDRAWESSTRAGACARFRDAAHGGDRGGADLIHRVGGDNAPGKPDAGCPAL
jgi:hypothetical protein